MTYYLRSRLNEIEYVSVKLLQYYWNIFNVISILKLNSHGADKVKISKYQFKCCGKYNFIRSF